MPSLLLPLLAAVAGTAWVGGLWYLGAYTPPALMSWRRLARYRGLADERPWGDRVGERFAVVRRIQDEIDLRRLLAIAGASEAPTAWLLKTAFVAGLACVCVLAVDEAASISQGSLPLPPVFGPGVGAAIALLCYVSLRSRAKERQRVLGRAVADSLVHVAVVTYHQRLPVSEALFILARCHSDHQLEGLLANDRWRQAGPADGAAGGSEAAPMLTTADVYERIGSGYGIPILVALAGVLRRVNEKGLNSREAYTQLARSTYADILAEARVAAAQAKTLIVIPMGFMILPILLLIGAPLLAALSGIFAR